MLLHSLEVHEMEIFQWEVYVPVFVFFKLTFHMNKTIKIWSKSLQLSYANKAKACVSNNNSNLSSHKRTTPDLKIRLQTNHPTINPSLPACRLIIVFLTASNNHDHGERINLIYEPIQQIYLTFRRPIRFRDLN